MAGAVGGSVWGIAGGVRPPLSAAAGAGQGLALRGTSHRLRTAGHDGVGLLGVRRRGGAADGLLPPLAVPGAGLTARDRLPRSRSCRFFAFTV